MVVTLVMLVIVGCGEYSRGSLRMYPDLRHLRDDVGGVKKGGDDGNSDDGGRGSVNLGDASDRWFW